MKPSSIHKGFCNTMIQDPKLINMSIISICVRISSFYDKLYTVIIRRSFRECKGLVRRRLLMIGGENISIGKSSCIGRNCILTVWKNESEYENPEIVICDNVSIGDYSHISAINKVYIGDGVLTGRWVSIVDNNHGNTEMNTLQIMPKKRKVISKGPIIIGNNVWIGDKVTILSGVTIGEGAVIAANSVVSHDVEPFSVIAGVPGIAIKKNQKI